MSSATVSRVINNSGFVKSQTRKLVMKVIEENDYSPSAVARSLSKQDTSSVGVIITDVTNPFFSGLTRGISDMAERTNLNIMFYDSNEKLALEHRFLKNVKEQRVNGVIITPISEKDTQTTRYLRGLEKSGIPVVLVDRELYDENFDGIFIENKKGAYEAVELLIKQGHKNIGIIAGPETSRPGKERLLGYFSALSDHGIPVRDEYVVRADFKLESGYKGTEYLMNLDKPPTAVFTSNNMITLGSLKYLIERKYIVGKNISIVGFDDIEALEILNFNITVVKRPVSEMGRLAMKRIVEAQDLKDRSIQRIVLPTELKIKGSEKINPELLN